MSKRRISTPLGGWHFLPGSPGPPTAFAWERSSRKPHTPAPDPLSAAHPLRWRMPAGQHGGGFSRQRRALAPDSRHLAIGTLAGRLRVIDCYSGESLFETQFAEGMIKCLEWSPDGSTLYVGEQSPNAHLVAYHAPLAEENRRASFTIASRIVLADRIETSPLSANDRYAVYTLPAAHDLQIAADGRIFVAATHNWSDAAGSRNRSCLLCARPDGSVAWSVPQTGAWN